MDCIFCKIASGEIPSGKVFENEYVVAFNDINPQAPVHIIVIPKTHALTCADDVTYANSVYIAKIFEAIPEIARAAGLKNGYRVITNCGDDACQSVKHLHFHILGGKQLPDKMS
ncbi:MAG: histidine triad nucleotide-binding protein [Clostridia bacterium]|nr:histidine triad nucleotide-binding protein [Clostridia bacterium]